MVSIPFLPASQPACLSVLVLNITLTTASTCRMQTHTDSCWHPTITLRCCLQSIKMDKFKNNVVLVVNLASACGFTPQYTDLQNIYNK
jgi:hypothetical protein